MSDTFAQINRRKHLLLDRTEAQRIELATFYATIERPARMAGQVNTFLRNPFVIAGMGVCALKFPWRRLFKVSGWAWKGWKWFRLLKTFRRFV